MSSQLAHRLSGIFRQAHGNGTQQRLESLEALIRFHRSFLRNYDNYATILSGLLQARSNHGYDLYVGLRWVLNTIFLPEKNHWAGVKICQII